MKTARLTTIDPSVLPEQARQELHDFYRFLVGKYARQRPAADTSRKSSAPATAADLAASSLVGMWKDRDLGDSVTFARALREKAQRRNLS